MTECQKHFSLVIGKDSVELEIVSNGWSAPEDDFFELCGANRRNVTLLHTLIGLSLTAHVWEDYDAFCGTFYKGLLELQKYLEF